MTSSLSNWWGNMLCAVDTETTGLDPEYNEIVQICIMPLDMNIKPDKNHLPFYINIRPQNLNMISKKALKVNKLKVADLVKDGFDPDVAIDMLLEWFEKLDIGYTKHGTPRKIIPLGHNYGFDRAFIVKWLGQEQYDELFHYHNRDTMAAAHFTNDIAAYNCDPIPYPKLKLTNIAYRLNVDSTGAHDALQDCRITAEVYRRLVKQGIGV